MKRLLAVTALGLTSGLAVAVTPAPAQLSIGISVTFAPPALPIYDQPPIPAPDYIWMPGYWAWDNYWEDYFWIPGTWMRAPRPGLLWTPAWWSWQDGAYVFHEGYWGPHVGFYGGVAYGFGYTGYGYEGAYWNGGHVYYNRSVTNITNVNVTNVYNKTVVVNRVTNVSYNGGPGGVQARPSAAEQAAFHKPHIAPTPVQQQHVEAARSNRQLFASANHGRPAVAATARPATFTGPGVVATSQAEPYHPQSRSSPSSGSPATPKLTHDRSAAYDDRPPLRAEQAAPQRSPVREGAEGGQGRPARAMSDERTEATNLTAGQIHAPAAEDRRYEADPEAPPRPARPPAPARAMPHPSAQPRPPHPGGGQPHPHDNGRPKPPSRHDDHHG